MQKADDLARVARGAHVAYLIGVPGITSSIPERRASVRTDRRRRSRSGRRDDDPRVNWRKWAWLFAVYGLFMSLRSLPSTVKKRLFERSKAIPL
jgi:hypothetical protein